MNLKWSFWIFENAISKTFCDEIINFGLNQNKKTAFVGEQEPKSKKDHKDLSKIRKSNIAWLSEPWIYNEINPIIKAANKNAEWNYQWDWNEACQFTIYNKGQFYGWHQDTFPSPYSHTNKNPNLRGKTRKLSMTLQLSDSKEYTGGELEFSLLTPKNKQYVQKVNNTKKGTLIVFPSFVWHRVKPVKKGTRYSLVNWSCGAPWV
tara:strand:+ start:1973 stop:2587 length:615 start_codon:yes stop_codon:yes gene_type:complete